MGGVLSKWSSALLDDLRAGRLHVRACASARRAGMSHPGHWLCVPAHDPPDVQRHGPQRHALLAARVHRCPDCRLRFDHLPECWWWAGDGSFHAGAVQLEPQGGKGRGWCVGGGWQVYPRSSALGNRAGVAFVAGVRAAARAPTPWCARCSAHLEGVNTTPPLDTRRGVREARERPARVAVRPPRADHRHRRALGPHPRAHGRRGLCKL